MTDHNLDEKYAKLALTFFIVALFILLFFVFIKVFVDATAAAEEPYQFVKCPGDTNTYPENTDCDIADTDNDDDDKSEKATEEEEKAMDKAKDD